MAYTQADLDALKKAKASGALTVEYAGRRTTFRSLAELNSIIADIERELSPSTATPSHTVGVYSSGKQTSVLDRGCYPRRGW